MFAFLSSLSYWLFVMVGCVIAMAGGWSAISEGAFFKRPAGMLLTTVLNYSLVGLAIYIGWTLSIIGALLAAFLFWNAGGFGAAIWHKMYRRLYE